MTTFEKSQRLLENVLHVGMFTGKLWASILAQTGSNDGFITHNSLANYGTFSSAVFFCNKSILGDITQVHLSVLSLCERAKNIAHFNNK